MLRPFDPVGEIFQPIVTGPDRIPILHEERNHDREKTVEEPEGEKKNGGGDCNRKIRGWK